jgi:hypothetical protein
MAWTSGMDQREHPQSVVARKLSYLSAPGRRHWLARLRLSWHKCAMTELELAYARA